MKLRLSIAAMFIFVCGLVKAGSDVEAGKSNQQETIPIGALTLDESSNIFMSNCGQASLNSLCQAQGYNDAYIHVGFDPVLYTCRIIPSTEAQCAAVGGFFFEGINRPPLPMPPGCFTAVLTCE